MLDSLRFATPNELPAAERINSSYLSRLTLLAPSSFEAILDGQQPKGLTLPGLVEKFVVESARQEGQYFSPKAICRSSQT